MIKSGFMVKSPIPISKLIKRKQDQKNEIIKGIPSGLNFFIDSSEIEWVKNQVLKQIFSHELFKNVQ